ALPAQAYDRWGAWSSAYSPSFPVVHVDSCPNQFARFFTQPWWSIANNARAAMNEWFVSGGVDLRMRWTGALAATDTRCLDTGARDRLLSQYRHESRDVSGCAPRSVDKAVSLPG